MRRTPQFKLIQAAFHGDLRALSVCLFCCGQAKVLDMGRGRLRKAVEEVRVEGVLGEEGVGVLQLAASQGHMEICKYLVDTLQVDVDDADDKGKTSLFNAVTSGHRGIAEYLLDRGANPDQAMRCGLSPLHVAAGLGDCESVKLLLAKGAYVDPISTFGTPLHLAAKEGKDGTMKILLDHNADCNKMVNGMTPFLLATKAASAKCTELLVEAGADGTLSDVFLNCMSTAFMDDGDSVSSDSELEEAGANHHVPVNDNPMDRRKIMEFKSLGLEAVEKKDYLSAAGFYSKAMDLDPDDATLLSNRSLCWLYMGDGGKALLDAHECRKKWLDWSKACYRQGTTLMLPKDYASACEPLLDGFKLDPGNIEIENALSFGVLEDIPEHLLDKGRGCLRDSVMAARIGRSAGCLEGTGPLHVAASHGSMEVCRFLVERLKVDVNDIDMEGCSPLVAAIHGKHANSVKYLLDHGANQDKANHAGYNKMVYGVTPIFVAINHASEKCVQLLIEAGVDVKRDYVRSALADAEKSDSGVPANKKSAIELKTLGSMAFKRKNYHHAAGYYSKAMNLDPDDATLFSNRSLCWLRLGRGGNALLDAHECCKRRPDWPMAYFRLAQHCCHGRTMGVQGKYSLMDSSWSQGTLK
uniref:Uncharacterized protein n=1 Tax=Leersia perrieri TaxID=77586 RepID=A0A0D9VWG4_9ORYZ